MEPGRPRPGANGLRAGHLQSSRLTLRFNLYVDLQVFWNSRFQADRFTIVYLGNRGKKWRWSLQARSQPNRQAREFFHQKFSHVDIDRDGPSRAGLLPPTGGIVSRDTNFSRRRAALAESVCVGVSFRVSEWPFTQESMLASPSRQSQFSFGTGSVLVENASVDFWAESLSESPVIAAPARTRCALALPCVNWSFVTGMTGKPLRGCDV